jgi:secreted trypsin-like serine protease
MLFDSLFRFRPGMVVLAALFLGCAATPDPSDDEIDEEAGGMEEPIIGGSKATTYPEAALINMNGSACSGALIAPKVVLTAGHCIVGGSVSVVLPFANSQTSTGKGKVFDYNSDSQYVDPNSHDVGLYVLDKALSLASYPLVANVGVPPTRRSSSASRSPSRTRPAPASRSITSRTR